MPKEKSAEWTVEEGEAAKESQSGYWEALVMVMEGFLEEKTSQWVENRPVRVRQKPGKGREHMSWENPVGSTALQSNMNVGWGVVCDGARGLARGQSMGAGYALGAWITSCACGWPKAALCVGWQLDLPSQQIGPVIVKRDLRRVWPVGDIS